MSKDEAAPIRTAFCDYHIAAGGKMVNFAGFYMPVQYKGITAEHLAVRNNLGLFDLSHMGEIEVSGSKALDYLQRVTTNNVAALEPGHIQYNCMTDQNGGIVDDLLVYRLEGSYYLVVNAANTAGDFKWLESNLFGEVNVVDRSSETSLLAIQGPNAQKLMSELTDVDLDAMEYYTCVTAEVAGCEVLFSRTGYTGEDGFEIYMSPQYTQSMWEAITDAGRKHGLELIGLGARDTLRLEMKMALYGNDIDRTTTPIEAGMSWIVYLEKDFIGKDVIARQKAEKPSRRLVCLELEGRAFPRQGYDIQVDGQTVGKVTSGTVSPSLKKPIALGYVPRTHAKSGSRMEVSIRGKSFPAVVVRPPFYKHGSHR